ncbi:MAG: rhodanese-like domain-containing protein [Candidatus Promineifilaceae bacterium]
MRIKIFTLILFVVSFGVIACSDNETAKNVDPKTLADTIDVQTAASLQGRDDVILIDVREQSEYDAGHIPDITLIPMSEIQNRVSEIPTDVEVILTCRSGNRSGQVHAYLTELGYDNVHNMEGGILAWEAAGLEVEH